MTERRPDGTLLVGLDVGTQSIRALLIDARGGRAIARAARPTPTLHPVPGWAEYAPEALWRGVMEVLTEIAAVVPSGAEIAGIACASMGEAAVLLDGAGAPLGNAIAWFDRRTETVARDLDRRIGRERLFAITGLALDPTFTLCKLLWLRAHAPEQFGAARRVLNIADWVAWRLSGEMATDLSLASRTLCLDLHARGWSAEIFASTELDMSLLPPIVRSGASLGRVRGEILAATGLRGRPVVGVGGHDHICGGFAAGAARPGTLLDSLGTAEAIFLTLPQAVRGAVPLARGYVQGAMAVDEPLAYLGGGIYSSGGAVEWLRGLLGVTPTHTELIEAASGVAPGAGGVMFLPHLAYAAPPHIDTAARGAFVGLTAGTERTALFRAVLEGLALEARQLVEGMAALPGVPPPAEIRVVGGSTRNTLLLGIKAAAYGRPIAVIDEPEMTATGAALLGGIAAGIWPSLDAALADAAPAARIVEPDPAWRDAYATLYDRAYRGLYPALAPINHALADVPPSTCGGRPDQEPA